jgi:hypothetical protein
MRGHDPVTIDTFKGLWLRDDATLDTNSCPIDHQLEVQNLDFNNYGVEYRKLFGQLSAAIPVQIKRIFVYERPEDTYLIIVGVDGTVRSYMVNYATTVLIFTPSFSSGCDYDFVVFNGRLYFTPADSNGYVGSAFNVLQVYVGNTVSAGIVISTTVSRDAGGTKPASAMTCANSATAGVVQAGSRFFGVCYETDTGFITPPKGSTVLVPDGTHSVDLSSIPTGGGTVVARWIVCTLAIATPIPNATLTDYQFFFLTRIGDNSTTTLTVNFYDSQLLNDASYLADILENPYSGSSICDYHGRLVITAFSKSLVTSTNAAVIVNKLCISNQNDPETFNQVSGLMTIDTSKVVKINADVAASYIVAGLTDCQSFRDVLYVTKLNATYAITDNGQEPVFWQLTTIDQAMGAFLHGITTILDNGGNSIDYLLIANQSGIFIFNGYFNRPELTYKIYTYWKTYMAQISSLASNKISMVNDAVSKKVYISAYNSPDNGSSAMTQIGSFLVMDYQDVVSDLTNANMAVKWGQWTFAPGVNMSLPTAMALRNTGGVPNFYVADSFSKRIWQYALAGTVETAPPNAKLSTLAIRDADEKILHIAATRLNIYSAVAGVTVGQTLFDAIAKQSGVTRSIDLATVQFSNFLSKEITLPINFLAQRMYLTLTIVTPAAEPVFKLNKIVMFVKPMYSMIPG